MKDASNRLLRVSLVAATALTALAGCGAAQNGTERADRAPESTVETNAAAVDEIEVSSPDVDYAAWPDERLLRVLDADRDEHARLAREREDLVSSPGYDASSDASTVEVYDEFIVATESEIAEIEGVLGSRAGERSL